MKNFLGTACFTLIEILVVVATIAMLISILLPSLSRAKAYAREACCINNTRQIAMAYKSYMVDNKNEMPFMVSPGTDSPGYFRFLDDMTPVLGMTNQGVKVFKCPASPSPEITLSRLQAFKGDYLCGGDIEDIELKSQKNNGHGNNVYSFDISNPSKNTQAVVASKKPSDANCQQRIIYDRGYSWHVFKRSIIVASIDDCHVYKETKSLKPYWMLYLNASNKPKIVTSDADWPDLGLWPVD